MTQTVSSQNGSSLLSYAISKLNPEVFSHPIWVHFGKKKAHISLSIVDDLLCAASNLQEHDPSGACQILLICVFYQNYIGRRHNARDTARTALTLARRSGLLKEILWITWGACAICYQQKDKELASSYLGDLQAELIKQDEWVLANFVDVIKQSLFCPVSDFPELQSDSSQQQPVAIQLRLAFEWLQHWGHFAQFSKTEYITTPKKPVRLASKKINSIRPIFSIRDWHNYWRTLMRTVKSKMKKISQNVCATLPSTTITHEQFFEMNDLAPTVFLPKSERKLKSDSISLILYYLGSFRAFQNEQLICSWNSMKSQCIFKYLASLNGKPVAKDILMEMFWPETNVDSARRNLHQAIYSLRQTLREDHPNYAHVQFENNCYLLNPEMDIWCDFQEFEHKVNAGRLLESQGHQDEACTEFGIAESIYQGDFLKDDLYDDWPREKREYLWVIYLEITERLIEYHLSRAEYTTASILCRKVLSRDNYQEQVHRLLIQCYLAQGQRHLALRQYHYCVQLLMDELGLEPEEATLALYPLIKMTE